MEAIIKQNLGIDIPNYPDEGCEVATIYLGYQSHCLECSFERCYWDLEKEERFLFRKQHRGELPSDEEIYKMNQTMTQTLIAREYKVHTGAIKWAIKRYEKQMNG